MSVFQIYQIIYQFLLKVDTNFWPKNFIIKTRLIHKYIRHKFSLGKWKEKETVAPMI